MLANFLKKVKEAFPDTDPEALWKLASTQISEEFCGVKLINSSEYCGLVKVDGLCPYHKAADHDFYRRCSFVHTNGAHCIQTLKSRDLEVVWCTFHLNTPKSQFFLKRAGEYIVIKDTPYALSDDMLSIIGRVEATYDLRFVLKRERDERMVQEAKNYGLLIRLDEN